MKTSQIAFAGIIVLLSVIAYRIRGAESEVVESAYTPPAVIEVVLPEFPKESGRSEEMAALRQALAAYNTKIEERFEQLSKDAVAARDKNDEQEASELTEQLDALQDARNATQAQMEAFQDWANEQKSGLGQGELPGNGAVEPPPTDALEPPVTESESAGMDLGPLLDLAAAGLCVAQPALCPAITILAQALGIFSGDPEQLEGLMGTIGKMAGGLPVSPEEIQDALDIITESAGSALDEWNAFAYAAQEAGSRVTRDSLRDWASGAPLDALQPLLDEIVTAVNSGKRAYDQLPSKLRTTIEEVLRGGFSNPREENVFLYELNRSLDGLLPSSIEEQLRRLGDD